MYHNTVVERITAFSIKQKLLNVLYTKKWTQHVFLKVQQVIYYKHNWASASSPKPMLSIPVTDGIPLYLYRTAPGIGILIHWYRTDRMPYYTLQGCWYIYTLHSHTAGDVKGYTLHVYITGGGKVIHHSHPHCMGGNGYSLIFTLLLVERKTPPHSHCWL
jgi:hypothetical protein